MELTNGSPFIANGSIEKICTTDYDTKLQVEVAHFNSHPQMLPFIGREWGQASQKVLLLGESHFQPEGCPERKDTEWYAHKWHDLYKDEVRNTNTRSIVCNCCFQTGNTRIHSFFQTLSRELDTFFPGFLVTPFEYISFYNYFQRPAAYGDSLKATNADRLVAYKTLQKVAEAIVPNKIIFTSVNAAVCFYAHKAKDKDNHFFNNIVIDYTVHPCCSWWNRPVKRIGHRTGRQKFNEILIK